MGLCAEFPSLSYLDENRYAALEGITGLVKDIVADMEANSENEITLHITSQNP